MTRSSGMSATHDRSILLSTDALLIVYYLGLGSSPSSDGQRSPRT